MKNVEVFGRTWFRVNADCLAVYYQLFNALYVSICCCLRSVILRIVLSIFPLAIILSLTFFSLLHVGILFRNSLRQRLQLYGLPGPRRLSRSI